MRRTAYSAAAILGAVALLTVGTPTASQAFTKKELSLCYINTTLDTSFDWEWVADGPSFKKVSLDAGTCMAFDVQPGRYKITVESFDRDVQSNCPRGKQLGGALIVKRGGDTYDASTTGFFRNGEVFTDVKKNRRTSVTLKAECLDIPSN